jgi:hypothetical protein
MSAMLRAVVGAVLISFLFAGPPDASIAGRVIDAATRQPIADALVSLLNPAGGSPDTVRTDREGRFVFHRVPAGQWAVGATASGYPGTGGTLGRSTMTVVDGTAIGDVVVALKPFGVVSGSVHLPNGEPGVGLTVQAFRRVARGRLQAFTRTATDDQGHYRFGTLTPGDYVVSVVSSTAPLNGGPFVFPTTFLPGVISVDSGPARMDARIFLTAERGVEVSGTIVGAPASDVSGVVVHLRPVADIAAPAAEAERSTVNARGQFSFGAVTPGRYTLSGVKTPPAATPSGRTVVVQQTIEVGGDDMTGLSIPAAAGIRVSGRVVFDGQAPPPTAQQLSRPLVIMQTAEAVQPYYLTGRATEAGAFETVEVPPATFYLFAQPPEPWSLRSAMFRGQDITDSPIAIGSDSLDDVTDVVVTFTDKAPLLIGTVRDERSIGVPARVVAFPVDRRYWADPRTNRRSQLATADTTGVYRFARLPAGEYFVSVLESLSLDEWNDPVHLQTLSGSAPRVTLTEGLTSTVDLRIADTDVDSSLDASGPFVADALAPDLTTLTGTVRAAGSADQPVAGASVRLTRLADGTSWSTYSDSAGQFTFADVGHGRFQLNATKPAHLAADFGTSTPGLPGRVLVLEDGSQSAAHLVMHRGGVITGVVRDHRGRPLPSTGIRVVQVTRQGNRLAPRGQFGHPASPVTDDRGVYRVFGLPPGDYVVVAMPELLTALAAGRVTMADGADAAMMAHAPAFHPLARALDDASVIRLAAGEEAAGVDVGLTLARAAALTGTVLMPDGSVPAGQVSITLGTADNMLRTITGPTITTTNGKFAVRAWTTGTYQLRGRATIANRQYWATSQVSLGDDADVVLRLEPAPSLSVRVTGPGGEAMTAQGLRVTATPAPHAWHMPTVSSAVVSADGAAMFAGVFPGRYRLALEGLPLGWVVTSYGHLDITDTSTPVDAEVRISSAPNRVAGRVLRADGAPDMASLHVLAFVQDEAQWHADSDRVVVVAPDSLGHFVFAHLPAGAYHVVAVESLPTPHLADPSILRALLAGADAVVVTDGVPTTRDITVRR